MYQAVNIWIDPRKPRGFVVKVRGIVNVNRFDIPVQEIATVNFARHDLALAYAEMKAREFGGIAKVM